MSNKGYNKYNNKCDECGVESGGVIFKGQNNTRLCGGYWYNKGCGRNICFVCGKKETRIEWRKEEDCCGNPKMVKREVEMFSQEERDENDPNNPEMKLKVHYCEEHKEEAQKSPLKWTDADNKRIEKEKEQKKLEIEEKLNSQKGLFYCYEPFPRSVEWKGMEMERDCVYFWGKENGQNFFLMVPDTHPVLNDLKYTEKVKSDYDGREIEYTRYNLKKQFYLIEGVDNLPLESTPYNGYKDNDPYVKANSFNKFVGLNDKITIAPFENDEEQENQSREGECNICHKSLKPGKEGVYLGQYHGNNEDKRIHVCHDCYQSKEQEYLQNYAFIYSYERDYKGKGGTGYLKNDYAPCYAEQKDKNVQVLKQKDCPHCQPWKKPEKNNELDTSLLLQYFQKNDIKSIKIENEKLIIKYNSSQTETKDINNSELERIKSFAAKIGKSELFLSDLERSSNQLNNSNGSNHWPWPWILGMGGILAFILIGWLVIRSKKEKKWK